MGFIQQGIDRLTKALKTPAVVTKTHNFASSDFDTGLFLGEDRGNLLLDLLLECNEGANIKTNPRSRLTLYEAVDYAFPLFERARKIKADFMGTLTIESDDKSLNTLLNDFNDTLQIKTISNLPFDFNRGGSDLAKIYLQTGQLTGMTFGEMLRDDTSEVITGLKIAPSYLFTFQRFNGTAQLMMQTDGGIMPITPDNNLVIYRNGFLSDWDWGKPMTYGCEYFADMMLRTIIARKDTHTRIANPPSFNILSADQEELQNNPELVRLFEEKATQWKNEWAGAIKRMQTKGKASDILLTLPGKVTFTSTMFGQGATGLQDFGGDFDRYFNQLALRTDVPGILLGIEQAAGLGIDHFKVAKQMLQVGAKTDQENIGVKMRQVFDAFLMSIKASPRQIKDYRLVWTPINIEDEKLIAETELISANAAFRELETWAAFRVEQSNSRASNAYAEEIGRPELVEGRR